MASLFAGRSHERGNADMDDDSHYKDEEAERDKSGKNDSLKNTIKSRKAF